MEISIKIENPNESELELIGKLTKLEHEKQQELLTQQRKFMEDALTVNLPDMYQKMCQKMDKNTLDVNEKDLSLRKDK